MQRDKLITITMSYGDSEKQVIISLDSDDEIDSSDVYIALTQYLEEYRLEMEEETVH